MSYPKFAMLVRKLHEKTIGAELEWEPTDEDGVFQVAFPEFTIRVSMHQVSDVDVYYLISIHDSRGNLIEQVNDEQLKEDIPDSYVLMKAMYEAARRKALGVDEALDNILSQLEEDLPF